MIEIVIDYWIHFLLTIVTSCVVYVCKQYIGLKNGMLSLLRNEIIRLYESYVKIGICPSYMKENLNEIYVSYHKLGGNGLATAMVEELYKLPTEKKENNL